MAAEIMPASNPRSPNARDLHPTDMDPSVGTPDPGAPAAEIRDRGSEIRSLCGLAFGEGGGEGEIDRGRRELEAGGGEFGWEGAGAGEESLVGEFAEV